MDEGVLHLVRVRKRRVNPIPQVRRSDNSTKDMAGIRRTECGPGRGCASREFGAISRKPGGAIDQASTSEVSARRQVKNAIWWLLQFEQ